MLRLLVALVIIIFIQFSNGQDVAYEVYSVEEGLPSNQVYDILELNDELWFATDEGLVRYSGGKFRTFTTKDGLNSNVVLRVLYVSDSTFLYVSLNRRLGFYNGTEFQDTSLHVKEHLSTANLLDYWRNQGIQCIYSKTTKAFQFNPHNGLFHRIEFGVDTTIMVYGESIEVDLTSELCKTTEPGLSKCIIRDSVFLLQKRPEYSLLLDMQNDHPEALKIEGFSIRLIDDNNEIWLTGSNGVLRVHRKNGQLVLDTVLRDYYVTDVLPLGDHSLWVSTLHNGVLWIPNISSRRLTTDELDNVEIVLGFFHDGRFVFVSNEGYFYSFMNRVVQMKELTSSKALYWHDSHSNSYRGVGWEFGEKGYSAFLESLEFVPISSRYKRFGLKFASGGLGVSYIPDEYSVFNRNKSIPLRRLVDKRVEDLFLLNDTLLAGTVNGIYQIVLSDKNVETHAFDTDHDWTSLTVRDIELVGDYIFFSSRELGLQYIYEDEVYKIEGVDIQDIKVNSFFIETDSVIWLATASGVVKVLLNINKEVVRVKEKYEYNVSHGLTSKKVNDILLKDGTLWVCTSDGVRYIDTSSLGQLDPCIHLTLDDIRLDGVDSALEVVGNEIFLPPEANYLEVFVRPLTKRFIDNNVQYSWILYNREREGTVWQSGRDIRLGVSQIRPGNYILKIRLKNERGLVSCPYTLKLVKEARFTETKWFVVLISLISMMVISLLMYVYRRRSLHQKNRRIQQMQTEMTILRTQMNPHFVFNALNSLQGYIFKGAKIQASSYLNKLSSIIRWSFNYTKSEWIGLDEELQFINNYAELERIRLNNKFSYSIEIDENLENTLVPPLIIQPLIENVTKHAFNTMTVGGQLLLKITRDDHKLVVLVMDNGIGASESDLYKVGEHGLKNLRARLELLRVHGFKDASLQLIPSDTHDMWSTVFKLTLPIKLKEV